MRDPFEDRGPCALPWMEGVGGGLHVGTANNAYTGTARTGCCDNRRSLRCAARRQKNGDETQGLRSGITLRCPRGRRSRFCKEMPPACGECRLGALVVRVRGGLLAGVPER